MVRFGSIAIIFFLVCITASQQIVLAQDVSTISASIARTYIISEKEAEPGDIVALDSDSGTYRLARSGDTLLTGVIVIDPLILLETDSNGLPVAQNGEVVVNVSTIGGAISAGDRIAPSPIPGKGQYATSGGAIIGIAQESFEDATTTVTIDGADVLLGSIRVLLRGTDQVGEAGAAPLEPPGGPIPRAFKFAMALLIGVGSVYISFRNFGANIRGGIISVGRNPLAKRSIHMMVVLNVALILLVAGGGLLLSLAILLLPF